MRKLRRLPFIHAVWIFSLLAGCLMPSPVGSEDRPSAFSPPATPTYTPFQPLPPTAPIGTSEAGAPIATQPAEAPIEALPTAVEPQITPTSEATQIPLPAGQALVWLDARLPQGFRSALQFPTDVLALEQPEIASLANLRVEIGDGAMVSRWVYALATSFPTLVDGVSSESLRRGWRGESNGPFAGRAILMDEDTLRVFSAWWGEPAEGAVQVLAAGELLDQAWKQGRAWALLPFERLEPRWKVLEVDGLSPLRKDFNLQAYPLSVPISMNGDEGLRAKLADLAPAANRDPNKLTVVAMTGVTALVRATAYTMEQRGIQYPGKDIRDWLSSADITHISNEIPFAKDCPFPDPVQQGLRFCSDPRYIALLEEVGTDVVELTGDHFQDWGSGAMFYTLDLYRERGWPYYGGGADVKEARRPVKIEHNGNMIAFIGCNAKGGGYAQAGPNQPGAVVCGGWMEQGIAGLREEGYLPIATFQHFEYYTYLAQPNQKKDFRAMAQAGALVVSGSQAHQPQAMEFANGAFIHYGLGNLFFDQYDVSYASRQGFIDRHIFYNNRYIGTELLTILFVDYARPRPMTADERSDLLQSVFSASDW